MLNANYLFAALYHAHPVLKPDEYQFRYDCNSELPYKMYEVSTGATFSFGSFELMRSFICEQVSSGWIPFYGI